MRYINLDGISMRQMEICTTVLDMGSFTEAANALHVSQPSISKQVANLEASLGITLFIRSKGTNVQATPAGKILIDFFRQMGTELYRKVTEASDLQDLVGRPVILFTTPSARMDAFLRPALDRYTEQYPEENIRVMLGSPEEGVTKILDDQADMMICNPYYWELFNNDELRSRWIVHVHWSVGMMEENPLAQKERISWGDLRDMEFVIPGSQVFLRNLNEYCMRADYHPKVCYMVKHFSGLSINVQKENEIFLTDRFLEDYGKPGFRYFDMEDTESGLVLVSKKNGVSERVRTLLRFLEKDSLRW